MDFVPLWEKLFVARLDWVVFVVWLIVFVVVFLTEIRLSNLLFLLHLIPRLRLSIGLELLAPDFILLNIIRLRRYPQIRP